MRPGTPFSIEVNPRIPRRLARLSELAENLWYAWDRPTRTLFARLHPGLWDAVNHNPKAFLKRVDEERLTDAAEDHVFLGSYNRVLSSFDTYMSEPLKRDLPLELKPGDLIAYFCAEFGFHESFPVYSGGLGILAGDHCKSASDMRLPFVAVGLLYRQGYFHQRIDNDGNQIANYADSDFDDLPIRPALTEDGVEIHVLIELPGRTLEVKVWEAHVGHVRLYLLDSDLPSNSQQDRYITHQLYGGDKHTRIQQEIVLGIGGMRALAALDIKPTAYHINEGHAAFLVLERIRRKVTNGLSFHAAMEAVGASTVFTTHTPVPAGHDHFAEDMIWDYFSHCCADLGISREEFMRLGGAGHGQDFNMTRLALNGSRHHNGVSRIHGGVSSSILADMWPQVAENESPMDYITNGVHVASFLAQEWQDMFDNKLGYEWRRRICEPVFWRQIEAIPDHLFWSVHQGLKAQLLYSVRYRITQQHLRNHGSEAHLERMLKFANPLDPNVLTIGFGRRFATYKRATLIFENMDWLRQIINDQHRPVLFIYAGKAHPADKPGQELIRRIHEISRMPEFEGNFLMVEGYDLGFARRLVAGCDVWLNNPIYPLEASGTSGMKAAMNGVLNLSVTDGWWDEGYQPGNGWAIKPAPEYYDEARRNREDSQTLYELLQDQVIPLYYRRQELGFSEEWVDMAKRSISTLLPAFNATRMVMEYANKFYAPASRQWRRYSEGHFAAAQGVAAWKAKVRVAWDGVALNRMDDPKKRISFGESMEIHVAVNLNGLAPEDVRVEVLLGRASKNGQDKDLDALPLVPDGWSGQECIYKLEVTPEMCGRLLYRVRAYPMHSLLTHPFEMGLMVWL
ncbi:MAG: alpha-glucan family phosphorylase [Pseudomonadota bacterium]|nr:alpha-glucan family phosphorylase [Pseudomonadota bacterium]MDP1903438.1 alpha-glucan family phosphorylase [Pseudomonadota bacterium]MDP2352275.1 alpha-glucan family phosphorylase [Pseudomonadota bacterium]